MIPVTRTVCIDPADLAERFIAASGPGGQNVNKVATAVQLRYNLMAAKSLSERVRANAARLAGRRLGKDGFITIDARTHRTQEANRAEALERLVALLREAAAPPPKARKPTKPTRGSKLRRLDSKSQRGGVKKLRGKPISD